MGCVANGSGVNNVRDTVIDNSLTQAYTMPLPGVASSRMVQSWQCRRY